MPLLKKKEETASVKNRVATEGEKTSIINQGENLVKNLDPFVVF